MDNLTSEMHSLCAELRFAEGLRRRSAEARAESTIREACAIASYSGARVNPDQLRNALMAWERQRFVAPDTAVALGAWRAIWTVVSALPELNARVKTTIKPIQWRSFLATMQRDYGSFLVTSGLVASDQIAIAKNPPRFAKMMEVMDTWEKEQKGTAIERAAKTWGLFLVEEPFAVGNKLMGMLAAKRILAGSGVEPTAVSVLSIYGLEAGPQYGAAIDAVRAGDWEQWNRFVVASVSKGCQIGQQIARQVQAARLA